MILPRAGSAANREVFHRSAETIASLIFLLFSILGIVDVIRMVVFALLKPKRGLRMVVTVPLSGHREDVEYMIRSAVARAKWSDTRQTLVFVVDCGMDHDTYELCRLFCNELGAELVAQEELCTILEDTLAS